MLDDHAPRATELQLGLALIGTAGILLRARQQGRLAAVRPALDVLRRAGLYLSDDLYRLVLKVAGE